MESGQIVAGKYRLNQLLGSGGMAEVWSVTNTFTERQLAIKFMNTSVAKTPEAATRFLKEAKVSARVNHPNIIDINDVGQTESGQLFLVMELLTGFPLEVALRRQNPPMKLYEFALVMTEVAQALAAAHKSGIIHRDLKPTNIFLHKIREGVAVPKLLDFGVSKFLEDDGNHALTVAGTVLGSPLYMSPEQARGDGELDGRTDVFAFGAIVFEALCGHRPYEAKNFNALIVKIATTRPESIDRAAPDAPESLRAVVRACLEPNLDERAQNFEEVLVLLRHALADLASSKQRLPSPVNTTTDPYDPEATNAMPVLRVSDRPTAEKLAASGIGSAEASLPPGAVSLPPFNEGDAGSWNTPKPAYASTTTTVSRPASGSSKKTIALGAFLLVGIGIGIAVGARGQRQPENVAATSSVTAAQPAATGESTKEDVTVSVTTPSVTANTDVQTISVNALPVASSKHGKLSVSSSPGACTLTVDGKPSGATPIANLDLPVGSHQLRCEGVGKSRTSTVTVLDGATTKVRFALDD